LRGFSDIIPTVGLSHRCSTASGNAALPLISIIMLGITYGLQVSRAITRSVISVYSVPFPALIFIIKREFMLVGWMVVYLLS
jgi:chitin synthase